MKIHNIDLYYVRVPLTEPWRTAYGMQSETESLVVRLETDTGVGWGESTPAIMPLYNAEYAAGAYGVAEKAIAPLLLGAHIESGEALQTALSAIKGNEFAKSAFDCAWWDAYAKSQNKPLWRVIGGQTPTVSVGADLPVFDTTDQLIERVGTAVNAGFLRIKLKFNRLCSYETIATVRTKFPDLKMHIDCNSGYTLDDINLFKALDTLDLTMIEQPLGYDDLIDHAALQKQLKTPICLDESITSLEKARKAIEIGACRWINIKTSRVGGLTNAISIHDYCAQNGVPIWVGGMLESTVGQGCSLALATLGNVKYPSDIFPSSRFYKTDLGSPEIAEPIASQINAPDIPGHGFAPNEQALKRFAIDSTSLSTHR